MDAAPDEEHIGLVFRDGPGQRAIRSPRYGTAPGEVLFDPSERARKVTAPGKSDNFVPQTLERIGTGLFVPWIAEIAGDQNAN
ncbi:MAG TPA: hypothetical protein VEN78_27765 [Bradyrhizobium sp.]|nr:hypothetical protein [Bradyrhizobium sp.]